MKFATYDDGSLDGRLLLVAKDGGRAAEASAIAPSSLTALQRWRACEAPPRLAYPRPAAGPEPLARDDLMWSLTTNRWASRCRGLSR